MRFQVKVRKSTNAASLSMNCSISYGNKSVAQKFVSATVGWWDKIDKLWAHMYIDEKQKTDT